MSYLRDVSILHPVPHMYTAVRHSEEESGVVDEVDGVVRQAETEEAVPDLLDWHVEGDEEPGVLDDCLQVHCTSGGTRTHTIFRPADFKSAAYAVPPPRHVPLMEGMASSSRRRVLALHENWDHVRPRRGAAVRVGVVDVTCARLGPRLALEEVALPDLAPLVGGVRRVCSLRQEAAVEGVADDVVRGEVRVRVIRVLHAIFLFLVVSARDGRRRCIVGIRTRNSPPNDAAFNR